ncbi:hypothetical protein BGX23_004253 [Mortierella sp. AD031]|nr:hypothetical protein BGX23_004253 [Mortierella sp. AD031]
MVATLDIIIANSPCQTVTIPYEPHESVFYVLQPIRAAIGSSEDDKDHDDLFVDDMCLSYDRDLGHTITYRSSNSRPQTGEEMPIQVKTLTGRLLNLVYHPDMLVEQVKAMVEEVEGIPVDQQRLNFAGQQLEDKFTLQSLQGGVGGAGRAPPGTTFSDVSDTSQTCKVWFAQIPSPGRWIYVGTNIECNCACTPTHQVVCQMNLGIVELNKAIFKCPNCLQSDWIVPVTVGFAQCKYRFHGLKTTGEHYISKWKTVRESDCYQVFGPDEGIVWVRLIIESAKLDECDTQQDEHDAQ